MNEAERNELNIQACYVSRKTLEIIDDLLCEIEDISHGNIGERLTEARRLIQSHLDNWEN